MILAMCKFEISLNCASAFCAKTCDYHFLYMASPTVHFCITYKPLISQYFKMAFILAANAIQGKRKAMIPKICVRQKESSKKTLRLKFIKYFWNKMVVPQVLCLQNKITITIIL